MRSDKIAFWNLNPVEQKQRMKAVLVLYVLLSVLCLIKIDPPYNYLLILLLASSFVTSYIKADKNVKRYQSRTNYAVNTKSEWIKFIVFIIGLLLLNNALIYGIIAIVICIVIDIAEIILK